LCGLTRERLRPSSHRNTGDCSSVKHRSALLHSALHATARLSHLWRQDQCRPVIPPPKLRHHARHLGRLIFVHKVPRVGENLQLVLALHLADHQFFVETVRTGEEEELGTPAAEELGAEVLEPSGPEGLSR
jgi:hypothetical protein